MKSKEVRVSQLLSILITIQELAADEHSVLPSLGPDSLTRYTRHRSQCTLIMLSTVVDATASPSGFRQLHYFSYTYNSSVL